MNIDQTLQGMERDLSQDMCSPTISKPENLPIAACGLIGRRLIQEDAGIFGEVNADIQTVDQALKFLEGQVAYIAEITKACKGIATLNMTLTLPSRHTVACHLGDTQMYSYSDPYRKSVTQTTIFPDGEISTQIPGFPFQGINTNYGYSIRFLNSAAHPFNPLLELHRVTNPREIEALSAKGIPIQRNVRGVPFAFVSTPAGNVPTQITGCVGHGNVSKGLNHKVEYKVLSPADLMAMGTDAIIIATDGFETAIHNHTVPREIMSAISQKNGLALLATYCAGSAVVRKSMDNVTVIVIDPRTPPKKTLLTVLMDCTHCADVGIKALAHFGNIIKKPNLLAPPPLPEKPNSGKPATIHHPPSPRRAR